MRLYSHVALMAAVAAPAFCQMPPTKAAVEAQARAMADQAREAVKAAQAQVMSSDKMLALQEKLADRAVRIQDQDILSADKMAEIQEKIAQATEKFNLADQKFALKNADLDWKIQEKIAEATEKAMNFDIDRKMELMQDKFAEAADKFSSKNFDLDLKNFDIDLKNFDIDMKLNFDSGKLLELSDMASKFAGDFNMAFLQPPPAPPAPMPPPAIAGRQKIISIGRGDGEYDRGTQALDERHYEEAVQRFDQTIASKSTRADGALYWKAYALNRTGKRDEALATIATLRKDYASSPWLNDAQALETEIKQNSGQAVSPNQESNDDLKLLAINSLMSADAERAIPLIEGILKGNSPPKVKRNALFVLTQSRSPRAQQVLSDYAKGGGNPDLQLQAIRYLGQSNSRETQQQLGTIYGTVSDPRVKSTIINSLADSRSFDSLLNIAKTEKDPNLRNSAIRAVAGNKNAPIDGLMELYPSLDASAKISIVDGLRNRRDAKTMVDLARKETDSATKKRIVERLADMHESKDAMDFMMELLKQ